MKKLTTIQTAVKAYSDFLTAGISYGDAMQAAAKELGDTPCITLLEELAKVHATKYGCNYTWNTAGTAVFYTGEESTRESRHGAAFQSWRRNVMVWFTPEKAKAPAKQQRISTAAKAMAMEFLGNFEGETLQEQIKQAMALLNALK
jgi:hypothetical protein